MKRQIIALSAVLAVATLGALPSEAATKAKKVSGSYDLTLYPNLLINVTGQVPGAATDCQEVSMTIDKHPFTVPGAGKLVVNLTSPDPTPAASPLHADWDLYLVDGSGTNVDASHGPTASETTTTKFKRRTALTFVVCNLNGETKGKVSYTFTPA